MAIMEGSARAAKTRHDQMISHAWHTAVFNGHAERGKLKPLGKYLSASQSKAKASSSEEILAFFQTAQERGAKMNIRRVH